MAEEVREQWVMKFDGSSTAHSGGVGVVLYHEEDKAVALSFKLEFPCSNNTAEYEAYLTGLVTVLEIKSFCKWGDKYANEAKIQKKKKDKGEGRYIPIKTGSDEALPSSSEPEIVLFSTGASSGSSKMSTDPSEDRSRSGPRVAEPGMEEGVTTREALPFAAWEISAKGSLVEITSDRTGEVVLV